MFRKPLAALLTCLLFSMAACSLPFRLSQSPGGAPTQPAKTAVVTLTSAAPAKSTSGAAATPTQPSSTAMVLTTKEMHETSADPKYQLDARWPYLD